MRQYLFLALKVIISIASLTALAYSVSWSSLLDVLLKIQLPWALLALLVFWAAQGISALRCAYIARRLGAYLDFGTSVRAHFLGLWFNQVLPTSLGGDVVKIAVLKKPLGLGIAVRATVLDRLSGLILLMLAIALTLPLYTKLFNNVHITLPLTALSIGFLLALPLGVWIAAILQQRLPDQAFLQKPLQLLADLPRFRKGLPLWEQTWTSTIVHFNGIAAYGLLGQALGIQVDWLLFVLLVPLVFLVALIPLSFAGWGIREAGAVWLFGAAGIAPENALAMSVCFGLMLIVASVPGLLLFMSNTKK